MGNYVTRFACAFQFKRAMIAVVVMMVMMIFGTIDCSGSSDEAARSHILQQAVLIAAVGVRILIMDDLGVAAAHAPLAQQVSRLECRRGLLMGCS